MHRILLHSLTKDLSCLYVLREGSHCSLAGVLKHSCTCSCAHTDVHVCTCREVLCSPLLLSAPERVDWRQCSVGKDEETRMAAQMRSNFQPFDFTDEL